MARAYVVGRKRRHRSNAATNESKQFDWMVLVVTTKKIGPHGRVVI